MNFEILLPDIHGNNKLPELRKVKLFLGFSAKFEFLNMRITKNFKNVIVIACKWCRIFKHYVNSMVISYSTCKKEENKAFRLNFYLALFCRNIKFVGIFVFFSFAKSEFQKFHNSQKKNVLFQVCCQGVDKQNYRTTYIATQPAKGLVDWKVFVKMTRKHFRMMPKNFKLLLKCCVKSKRVKHKKSKNWRVKQKKRQGDKG